MRYQSIASFSKHIASAAPHHLCRCYLIAIPDDYERKRAMHLVLSALGPPECPERSNTALQAIEALSSFSLFGSEPIAWMDEVDKLLKADVQTLSQFLQIPFNMGFLILGTKGSTPLTALVEKQGVVLDLLGEKPWEKEKRLIAQMVAKAESAGKKLPSDAAALLIERVGTEVALLEKEIEKLLCYIADRSLIERSDILRLSQATQGATLWQTADEIVWEGGGGALSIDPYSLIPAIRSQLQVGHKLAALIEAKVPPDQWGPHLPKLYPKTLEKRSQQAAHKGSEWFRKGLELLFQVELLSRDGSSHAAALLDYFRMALYAR